MLNISELEKQWLKYKIKSYIPLAIIVGSSSIILGLLLSFSSTTSKKQSVVISIEKNIETTASTEKNTSFKTQQVLKEVTKNNIPVNEVISSKINIENAIIGDVKKVKLTPSLDFLKKMQNSVQPYYKNENTYVAPIVEVANVETQIKTTIETTPIVQDKPQINIERKNTHNDIYEIIKRFKKNNNPALSLFIAKKYYELKDYRQSYNYSLITNEINQDIESSWIVFAKSLVKLGKKDKAIATLKKYINHSHSNSAKILYDEIRSGKFQ